MFALFAQDGARSFVRLRELQQTEDKVREQIEKANDSLGAYQAELMRVQEAEAARPPVSNPSTIALVMMGVLILLGFVLFILDNPGFGMLVFLLALISGGVGMALRSKHLRNEELRTNMASQAIKAVQDQLTMAQGAVAQGEAALRQVEEERKQVSPRPDVQAVGRIYHTFRWMDLAGYPVLLDEAGATEGVPLRMPDLATDPERIGRIREVVGAAKKYPVLLQSSGAKPSLLGTLQGEEKELEQALSSFTQLVESVPMFEEQISLVPAEGELAQYVAQEMGGADVEQRNEVGPELRRGKTEELQQRVQRITELATRLRSVGGDVGKTLREVQTDLSETLEAYRSMRTESMMQVQRGLAEVLARSDLPYLTYYCPKCHRIPAYLLNRVGLDLASLEKMPMAELLAALESEPEAKARIEEQPDLLDGVGTILDSLAELRGMREALAQSQNDPAIAMNLQSVRILQSRLRALDDQIAHNIEHLHSAIRHIMTGQARPVLELSRVSRLLLDPDDGVWSCQTCGTRFTDPAQARMGRMLRMKDELLMPLWNQLWQEKDDFRKAELFRTNEQLQRLMEKEVSALREVAEQYRADMRPVRENLIIAISEADSKRKQLDATVRSLAAMGVLRDDEVAQGQQQLSKMAGGNFEELKRSAGNKETILNLEPQNQMNRRPPPSDPVRVFLRPEELFEYRKQTTG